MVSPDHPVRIAALPAPGARPVEVIFGGNTDRADHVRDGRADVALLYLPFDDTTGLRHETLYIEGRLAVLPRNHRLAAHAQIAPGRPEG